MFTILLLIQKIHCKKETKHCIYSDYMVSCLAEHKKVKKGSDHMDSTAHINTDLVSFGYSESTYVMTDYALHCHNFYEVFYFLSGDADYLVEGVNYQPTPGSVLLLSPHAFHGVRVNSTAPYRRYSLHFHPDLLLPERRDFLLRAFPQTGENARQPIYFKHTEQFHLLSYLESLESCSRKSNEFQAQMLPICVEALLMQIADMSDSCNAFSKQSDTPQTQLSSILFYLNQHLKDPVTLDEISDHFFISKHHLNKVFKKTTGTTVIDYLLRKRIAYAQMLLFNGCHAKEAAANSGFLDYSSFYRSYVRILGHPPGADRGVLAKPNDNVIGNVTVQI